MADLQMLYLSRADVEAVALDVRTIIDLLKEASGKGVCGVASAVNFNTLRF